MAESPVQFQIESDDPLRRKQKESICRQVCSSLKERLPTAHKPNVICFIDSTDYDRARFQFGEANRGFFAAPLRGVPLVDLVPFRFLRHLAQSEPGAYGANLLYDSLIYLYGSTARTDLGLALTLAHELCHFCQYATRRHVWAVNKLTQELDPPHVRSWSDIPVEQEARLLAKQVGEELFGEEAVRKYIEATVRKAKNHADEEDWRSMLNLSTSTSYDTEGSTRRIVTKYKAQLQQIQSMRWMDHPDVSRLDLETLEFASVSPNSS